MLAGGKSGEVVVAREHQLWPATAGDESGLISAGLPRATLQVSEPMLLICYSASYLFSPP